MWERVSLSHNNYDTEKPRIIVDKICGQKTWRLCGKFADIWMIESMLTVGALVTAVWTQGGELVIVPSVG